MACTVLAAAVTVGCTGSITKKEPVELLWYLPSVPEHKDFSIVMERVNGILEDRYGLRLNMVGLDNYEKEMELINAGRKEYDLAYTSSWSNDYYTNVSKGACLNLTELLPVYAPKLFEQTEAQLWEAVSIKEQIYAVPNWQIEAKALGFSAPTEFLEDAGVSVENINTLEDIEIYMSELVKKRPDANMVRNSWSQVQRYYGFLDVLGEGVPGVINYKLGGKPIVVNQYDSQEFEDYVRLRSDWVNKGYMSDSYNASDLLSSKAEDKEVKRRPYTLHIYVPAYEETLLRQRGYSWTNKQMSDAVLDSGSVLAALTCVSSTTTHAAEAVTMLEIINTDAEIYNLLVWGIEGMHYEKLPDGKISVNTESGYEGIDHFHIGSQKNIYLTKEQADDAIQQIADFNTSAIQSPILGFSADTGEISAQVSNCNAIIAKRRDMLDLGLADPDADLEQFRRELKEAGVDAIISELQKQIDKWWQEKNS